MPLETSKECLQAMPVYLYPEKNGQVIMRFCFSREKLAVARLQREVAQRRSEGAMVSPGWFLLILNLPYKGLWFERHFVSLRISKENICLQQTECCFGK